MTVARDDLRADRLDPQAHLFADVFLDRRVDVGEGPDGTGNRAGGDLPFRFFETVLVAVHFRVKPRKDEAHGGRFRMDAVAATDADAVFVLMGPGPQRGQHPVDARQQQVRGAGQLDTGRRVEHVRGGHALMHEARVLGPDVLCQMGQKGDDVVFRDRLDLVDAGHVERHVLGAPHGLRILARDHAEIRHRIAGVGLDLVPDAELGLG